MDEAQLLFPKKLYRVEPRCRHAVWRKTPIDAGSWRLIL
jgi:hypothetical protein